MSSLVKIKFQNHVPIKPAEYTLLQAKTVFLWNQQSITTQKCVHGIPATLDSFSCFRRWCSRHCSGLSWNESYIFICCKVLHPMYFTKQSQGQIYSINIFGGRMSLSKTEECFLNSRSYDSWVQEVISLALKESMLMYIHAVVLCTQAIYTPSRMHKYLCQSTQMTPEITQQN